MPDWNRAGLKAAAERFARAMRTVAGVRTNETAAAVNVAWEGDTALVRGGEPGGPWQWTPIQAAMFDDNLRHPLFGNKRHWYKQGRWPITAYTERAAINDVDEVYADAAVDPMLAEYGFE